jgi:nucleoid DNA-binding protein
MNKKGKSIDRQKFIRAISKRLKHQVAWNHVLGVSNILLDQFMDKLIEERSFKIGNFGSFFIRKMKDRRHKDIFHNKIVISKGKNMMRFTLEKKVRDLLINHLDLAETFPPTDNE